MSTTTQVSNSITINWDNLEREGTYHSQYHIFLLFADKMKKCCRIFLLVGATFIGVGLLVTLGWLLCRK